MPSRQSKPRKSSTSRPVSATDRVPRTTLATHTTPRPDSGSFESSTPIIPKDWPSTITYLTYPVLSAYLPRSHLKWLRTKPPVCSTATTRSNPSDNQENLPVITVPLSSVEAQNRVEIRVINDERHPAFGQRGLFAAKDLEAGELVVAYLGYVHSSTVVEKGEYERHKSEKKVDSESKFDDGDGDARDKVLNAKRSSSKDRHEGIPGNESDQNYNRETEVHNETPSETSIGNWDTSSYDLNLYRSENIELAIDAATIGNEARFVNDYRGVPVQHNSPEDIDLLKTRERREKRKVKGWKGCIDDQHERDPRKSQHEYDIAMPNAEFRDVWFQIDGELDLHLHAGRNEQEKQSSKVVEHVQHSDIADAVAKLGLQERGRSSKANIREDENGALVDTFSERVGNPRRKKKEGVRGVAIYVMPAGKAGKRKNGIRKGQEILVSYGKGFWAHHGVESEGQDAR